MCGRGKDKGSRRNPERKKKLGGGDGVITTSYKQGEIRIREGSNST